MRKNKVKMLIFIPDSYPDKGKNTVHGQGIHFSLVHPSCKLSWPDVNHSGFLTLKCRRLRGFPIFRRTTQIFLTVGKEYHLPFKTHLNINYSI